MILLYSLAFNYYFTFRPNSPIEKLVVSYRTIPKFNDILELSRQQGIIDGNTEIVLDAVVSMKTCEELRKNWALTVQNHKLLFYA